MRYTVRKLFFAWDFEGEEKWLNEMSAKGMQLVSTGICKYVFEEGHKGEYIYRIELLENWPTHAESNAYIRFLEETGVEHVGSLMRWVYFRKKAAEGGFEIYSDIDSKIKHYKRTIPLFLGAMVANIAPTFMNLNLYLDRGERMNAITAGLCGSMVALLGLGIYKISRKVNLLKKEKAIRE